MTDKAVKLIIDWETSSELKEKFINPNKEISVPIPTDKNGYLMQVVIHIRQPYENE